MSGFSMKSMLGLTDNPRTAYCMGCNTESKPLTAFIGGWYCASCVASLSGFSFTPPPMQVAADMQRFDLVQVDQSDYHHDHVMEPDARGEWVRFDSLCAVRNALEAAEQILKRSQQLSTNDNGKFRGVTTSSALIEVRGALEKLREAATL